jgi:peptide/nickel transport system substrate-binding protein
MLMQCGMTVTMKEVPTKDYQQALKMKEYDIYLGQTKLSPNMDLSHFFSASGKLNYGALDDANAYMLCLSALENHGNYYTLYKTVMDEGLLCPILFRSYAIYATRGTITALSPSRDCVFFYSMGKNLEDIKTDWTVIPEEPEEDEDVPQ